jgi:hypothetical protein
MLYNMSLRKSRKPNAAHQFLVYAHLLGDNVSTMEEKKPELKLTMVENYHGENSALVQCLITRTQGMGITASQNLGQEEIKGR